MYRCMGFNGFEKDWTGPVINEFVYYVNTSKMGRHIERAQEAIVPDLYAPRFMLPPLPDRELPDRILVAIGKGYEPVRRIGFVEKEIKQATASSVWNFEYDHEVGYALRYFAKYEGQTYNLHLPRNVFAEAQTPNRLYLRIALPA